MKKMSKTRIVILTGVGLICTVIIWSIIAEIFFRLSPSEARDAARAALDKFAAEQKLDISDLGSPIIIPIDEKNYDIEWRYSHPDGELRLLIWVDNTGAAEISWDGDLDILAYEVPPWRIRLEQRAAQGDQEAQKMLDVVRGKR